MRYYRGRDTAYKLQVHTLHQLRYMYYVVMVLNAMVKAKTENFCWRRDNFFYGAEIQREINFLTSST